MTCCKTQPLNEDLIRPSPCQCQRPATHVLTQWNDIMLQWDSIDIALSVTCCANFGNWKFRAFLTNTCNLYTWLFIPTITKVLEKNCIFYLVTLTFLPMTLTFTHDLDNINVHHQAGRQTEAMHKIAPFIYTVGLKKHLRHQSNTNTFVVRSW